MNFDKSRFKKQDLGEVEQMAKQAQSTMINQFSNNGYTPFFTPEMGKNIVRILPATDGKVYVALKTAKLSVEVPKYDGDNNVIGKEVKEKNIFCADIHGQKMLKGKCPITTYINYAFKLAEDIQDEDERTKFLYPITGYQSKKGWVWGINPMLNFVSYVTVGGDKIHKFQLRKQWLDRLKEISIERSEESTLSVDIFSGIDDGFPLVLTVEEKIEETKVGKKKKKTTYNLSPGLPSITQEWKDFFAENTISDSVLENLAELPTLGSMYVDSYRKKDFDSAIDGLERFDKENSYGIFENEAFLDELESMAALIPEDDSEEEQPKIVETKRTATKPVVAKKEVVAAVENAKKYPPLIKLKAFLLEYIETEYEGTEELPDLNIAEFREWYDLAIAGEMLPFEKYKVDEAVDETEDIPFEGDSGSLGQEEEEEESPIDEDKIPENKGTNTALNKCRNLRESFKRQK